MQESGHYSIAGFFFQLLVAADDALKLYFADTDPQNSTAVFTLEKLGQDGVISYPDSDRLRLIQYKYSSTGADLEPNDLREILKAFRRSIEAAKVKPSEVECYLTTNRKLTDAAKLWFEGTSAKKMTTQQFKALLHDGVSAKNKSSLPYTKFHPVFERLEYDPRDLNAARSSIETIANSHGMLDHERDAGITSLIGFFSGIASSEIRDVNRQLLIETFVGRTAPHCLTGKHSLETQKKMVSDRKRSENCPASTIHRGVIAEIAKAVGLHPFIVVKGEGGCGKSVALCDAAMMNLTINDMAPGFVLVVKASELHRNSVQDAVRRWRNQNENPDHIAMDRSLGRLERAVPLRPVLTIYIDGIDERHGRQGLPIEARNFLCELIYFAVDSIRDGTPRFSIVVSCRNEHELNGLGGGGFPFAVKPFPYSVSEFSNQDLSKLATELGSCPRVGRRIKDHVATRQGLRGVAPSTEIPVDPDSIEIIRHPVFWRCFASLGDAAQHSFLDGTSESREAIALSYIEWFFQKVNARIGNLPLNATHVAMRNSAKRFLIGNPFREADLQEDWLVPCAMSTCPETHQMEIFKEAVSAGLIESFGDNTKWRWKRPWLCEYFVKEVSTNG